MTQNQTYRTFSNHTFTPSARTPFEVFTEADVDQIDPGKIVTDLDSKRFEIIEVRHVKDRLWRIVLLPLAEEVQA